MNPWRRFPVGFSIAPGLWSAIGFLGTAAFVGCIPLSDLDATGQGSEPETPIPASGGRGGSGEGGLCEVAIPSGSPRVAEASIAIEAETADLGSEPRTSWAVEKNDAMRGGSWLVSETIATPFEFDSSCAAPRADYLVDVAKAGPYFLWLKGDGGTLGGSVRVGLNENIEDGFIEFPEQEHAWVGSRSSGARAELRFPNPGTHTIRLWAASGSPAIDQIYLTQDADVLPLLSTMFSPSPMTVRPEFNFNESGNAEGWTIGEESDAPFVQVSDGAAQVTLVAGSARISRAGLGLDADSLGVMEIRGTFPIGTTFRVFFAREGDAFDSSNSVLATETGSGEPETYLVDLSNDLDFSGIIDALRITLGDANGAAQIDSIRMVAPPVGGVDPDCATGITNISGNSCCPAECGQCGGDGCGSAPLGTDFCCATGALSRPSCLSGTPPCAFPR